MPLIEFKQGAIICSVGEPLRNLLFVTKGEVAADFEGKTFEFELGDTIGLCALGSGAHDRTYTALTNVTAFSYPYEQFETLDLLIRDNADVSNRLVTSMCRQVSALLAYRAALKKEADRAFEIVTTIYPQYEKLCSLYAFSSKKLPGAAGVEPASKNDPVGDWLADYYVGIKNADPGLQKAFFRNPDVSSGFLRKCADDILMIMDACRHYQDYLQNISVILLNEDGHDLFGIVTELHTNSVNIRGADAAVTALIAPLAEFLSVMTFMDPDLYRRRLAPYRDSLGVQRAAQGGANLKAISAAGVKQNLSNSMDTIMEYSGWPEEKCHKFARSVHEYTRLSDRSSTEDGAYRLRRALTEEFYDLYQNVFMRSLDQPSIPTVIKMFLNFGYLDATLAGPESADYMYSIADSIKGDPSNGIYTIVEWLTAIYKGDKEPSRNDFDEDYATYVKDLKLTPDKEAKMLVDRRGKLKFELENAFPVANKITFGRMTSYCPLFADHNVQRGLDVSLVQPALLKQALDEIRAIDFSAYYRERVFVIPEAGQHKEQINIEVLPDYILMPNVGVRGAMWQEIEGRDRVTPSRMFMPIFLLEDLKTLAIRLTGEFRWEMCKRTQGPRWNDFADPSLTSAFFDYLQFYRSNRELSAEAKSNVKTELVRARNIYKAVFVNNYIEWLQYESNGSPRLNKFARNILFEYCPFPAAIREKLKANPQYADALKRYNIKHQQAERRLSNVIQKVGQMVKTVPRELLVELEYLKR